MKRSALLVGANGGEGTKPQDRLKYAESDIGKVFRWLLHHSIEGWSKDNIEFLVSHPKVNILSDVLHAHFSIVHSSIEKIFLEAGSDDLILFYFAGHAFEYNDQLYLVLNDSNTSNLDRCLKASEIINLSMLSAARSVISIFDCCYSGLAADRAEVTQNNVFQLFGRRKKKIKSRQSRAIVTSSRSNQASFETDEGDILGSLFTHYFIEGCEGGKNLGSVDGNGVVTLDSVVKYIGDSLSGQQNPRKWTLSDSTIAIQSRYEWRVERGNPGYKLPDVIMFSELNRRIEVPTLSHVWDILPQNELVSFDYANDSSIAVIGYKDQPIDIFNARDGKKFNEQFHSNIITLAGGIKISHDAQHIAIRTFLQTQGNCIRMLDLVDQTVAQSFTYKVEYGCTDQFLMTPHTNLMITSNHKGNLQIWSGTTGQQLAQSQAHVGPTIGNQSRIVHICSSSDGKKLASSDINGQILLWEVGGLENSVNSRGQPTIVNQIIPTPLSFEELPQNEFVKIMRLAFSSDSKYIAAACSDSRIIIWDLQTKKLVQILAHHSLFVDQIAFSPDPHLGLLASGGADGTIVITDCNTWASRTVLETGKRILSINFSPSRSRPLLVVATFNGPVFLINPLHGDYIEVGNSSARHAHIFKVCIAPIATNTSNNFLAIASTQSLEVWKVEWQPSEKEGQWIIP